MNNQTSMIQKTGLWMRKHRQTILIFQWLIIVFYLTLVIVPAFLPLPEDKARIWDNLTRLAQFAFWGVWWPGVIISIMLMGRVWCGVLCPEGALTEWASQYGRNKRIPQWIRWDGWPLVAFLLTTLAGQLISIYEYPKPVLLILGGSTIAAIGVGLLWGRKKRVWCRYLCPVNGVFALLAKVAPVQFRVSEEKWENAPTGSRTSKVHQINCAPLIDIRRMQSNSECHMCGRCAGERGAVDLAIRWPHQEIVQQLKYNKQPASEADSWQAILLLFGMLGFALGAFQWSVSPWFILIKQTLATWLVEYNMLWALESPKQWWLMTYYPQFHDTFNWLDGLTILLYISGYAIIIGFWSLGWIKIISKWQAIPWQHIALTVIPYAGINLFVGLSQLTSTQLNAEGIALPWANDIRMALLISGVLASLVLLNTTVDKKHTLTSAVLGAALALPTLLWGMQFYHW